MIPLITQKDKGIQRKQQFYQKQWGLDRQPELRPTPIVPFLSRRTMMAKRCRWEKIQGNHSKDVKVRSKLRVNNLDKSFMCMGTLTRQTPPLPLKTSQRKPKDAWSCKTTQALTKLATSTSSQAHFHTTQPLFLLVDRCDLFKRARPPNPVHVSTWTL